jgi:hypothetical protein
VRQQQQELKQSCLMRGSGGSCLTAS